MDCWIEALVFISKDDHLNKVHIKYLENRFYEVMNKTVPKKSSVSEAEKSEMEEFIDNAKLVVSVLGHKVFEPLVPVIEVINGNEADNSSERLYIRNNKGLLATGLVSPDGFIVLKGSMIN